MGGVGNIIRAQLSLGARGNVRERTGTNEGAAPRPTAAIHAAARRSWGPSCDAPGPRPASGHRFELAMPAGGRERPRSLLFKACYSKPTAQLRPRRRIFYSMLSKRGAGPRARRA